MIRRSLVFAVSSAALSAFANIVLASPAHAQDATDPARAFFDPNYLPLGGALYGSTGYTYGWSHDDTFVDGVRTGSENFTRDTIDQAFGYGITDDFAIVISDSYVPLGRRNDDPIVGPSFDRDHSGMTDPTIAATYRLLDERQNPVLLDVFASYSPNLFQNTGPDAGHEGSEGRGGDAASFGLALGREWDTFGVRASARAQWVDDRAVAAATGPTWSRERSSWDYALDLTSQVRLGDQFAFNFGGGYDINQNFGVTREPSGVDLVTHPGDAGNLHASLNYQIVPNVVAASLTYQFNDYNTRTTDNITADTDAQVRNHDENVLGIKFDYALN